MYIYLSSFETHLEIRKREIRKDRKRSHILRPLGRSLPLSFKSNSQSLILQHTCFSFCKTQMDEYKRSHVPAFGSWDCNDDLPFTQCFESARQAGLLRYSYSEDRDLYVAGDLYQNDVMTPAMIVVPRRTTRSCYPNEKDEKNQGWVCDVKEPPSPIPTPPRPTPKAVDEDLYKISPSLLRNTKSRRKRVMGFFSSCLLPTCVL